MTIATDKLKGGGKGTILAGIAFGGNGPPGAKAVATEEFTSALAAQTVAVD